MRGHQPGSRVQTNANSLDKIHRWTMANKTTARHDTSRRGSCPAKLKEPKNPSRMNFAQQLERIQQPGSLNGPEIYVPQLKGHSMVSLVCRFVCAVSNASWRYATVIVATPLALWVHRFGFLFLSDNDDEPPFQKQAQAITRSFPARYLSGNPRWHRCWAG